jgi:PDGLE domain
MRWFTIVVLAVAIGLATAASPFASSSPDGLNRVAADHGFAAAADTTRVQERAPGEGYTAPGVHDARVAKGLAGFGGTLLVFGLAAGAGRALRRRRLSNGGEGGPPPAAATTPSRSRRSAAFGTPWEGRP